MSFSSSDFKKFAIIAARSADAKKGSEISVLDLRRVQSGLSDYLILLSANSHVHLKTLRDSIEETLEQMGLSPLHRDGTRASRWVALDYGGLMVHIFIEEAREAYSLERLWLEAKRVPWSAANSKEMAPARRRRNSGRKL